VPINKEARTVMPAMRSGLVWVAIFSLLAGATADQTDPQSGDKKSVRAFLATGKGGKRTTTFSADEQMIYVFWKGEGFQVGDTVRCIWVAEDVGAGSKETEIRRADYKVYKQTEEGGFSLGRPAGRAFPVGKYRVELSINGAIAEVVKFTVKPGVTIEVH
jgi:hypothetical protein